MGRADPQVNFRCPEALLERLKASAEAAGTSLTQEIIARLEQSFPKSFDVLRLERLQRELESHRETRLDVLFILQKQRSQLSDEEIRNIEAELSTVEAEIDRLQSEVDRTYAMLSAIP